MKRWSWRIGLQQYERRSTAVYERRSIAVCAAAHTTVAGGTLDVDLGVYPVQTSAEPVKKCNVLRTYAKIKTYSIVPIYRRVKHDHILAV